MHKPKSALAIDLNADVGEGYGPYSFGQDEALLPYVSSANIACGYHAGDPHLMRTTVERCQQFGVAIGAHPGFPDRLGFGRRDMRVEPQQAADWLLYQIGALQAFAVAAGANVRHVKLHGAWYHLAARDEELAEAVVAAIGSLDRQLMLYGPPACLLAHTAKRRGLRYVAEGFADRAYQADGRLAPRNGPGAVLEDVNQALAQARALVQSGCAFSPEGVRIPLAVETLCIHGDTQGAAELARSLAEGLREAGIDVRAPHL